MDELREKIAAIVHRHKLKGSDAVAGIILALPEIKEALQAKAMRDLQRLGQEYDNHK